MNWERNEVNKIQFIYDFQRKTHKMAVDVIRFLDFFKSTRTMDIISHQLIKSVTSTGANYRAACKARSRAEFFAKISIVVEEADETLYWLEIIEGLEVECNLLELNRLQSECLEILNVCATARNKKYSQS